MKKGLSFLWSYGSWIYNYLCNQFRITTKVVSSNPAHGDGGCTRYNIMWCSLSVPCRRSVVFSMGTPVSSSNKTDCHDINEILLKVVLNTIIPFLSTMYVYCVFLAMLKSPKQLQNFTKNNRNKPSPYLIIFNRWMLINNQSINQSILFSRVSSIIAISYHSQCMNRLSVKLY